jgi:hypothetical protein
MNMGHPKVHNHTQFEFAPMFLADVDGQPLFVPLLKASYSIGEDQILRVAEEQQPIAIGGEFWGPPETSSYKLEPEGVIVKPATDVVLIGNAYPERAGDTETTVGLRVGPIRKLVRVIGDRYWTKVAGMVSMSSPAPFEKMPLRWERAYGGWDRSAKHPQDHRCETRNPVGTGFRLGWNDQESSVRLPNLEHPSQRIQRFDDRPQPVGFGFLGAHWQPRAALAGTYDERWVKSRMPLLPDDFDPAFLNAAPPDQIAKGYLQGDEEVVLINVSPHGRLAFNLPGGGAPRLDVEVRGAGSRSLSTVLDTVIVDAESLRVSLLWRGSMPVADVPTDVVAVHIASSAHAEAEPAPRTRAA